MDSEKGRRLAEIVDETLADMAPRIDMKELLDRVRKVAEAEGLLPRSAPGPYDVTSPSRHPKRD